MKFMLFVGVCDQVMVLGLGKEELLQVSSFRTTLKGEKKQFGEKSIVVN